MDIHAVITTCNCFLSCILLLHHFHRPAEVWREQYTNKLGQILPNGQLLTNSSFQKCCWDIRNLQSCKSVKYLRGLFLQVLYFLFYHYYFFFTRCPRCDFMSEAGVCHWTGTLDTDLIRVQVCYIVRPSWRLHWVAIGKWHDVPGLAGYPVSIRKEEDMIETRVSDSVAFQRGRHCWIKEWHLKLNGNVSIVCLNVCFL